MYFKVAQITCIHADKDYISNSGESLTLHYTYQMFEEFTARLSQTIGSNWPSHALHDNIDKMY